MYDTTEVTTKILKAQELMLKLIENATFNSFDGEQVANQLRANKRLWQGVIIDRPSYCFEQDGHAPAHKIDLIKLRDINSDSFNADTLYILATSGQQQE